MSVVLLIVVLLTPSQIRVPHKQVTGPQNELCGLIQQSFYCNRQAMTVQCFNDEIVKTKLQPTGSKINKLISVITLRIRSLNLPVF